MKNSHFGPSFSAANIPLSSIQNTIYSCENINSWFLLIFQSKILKIWPKSEKWNYNSNKNRICLREMKSVLDQFLKWTGNSILAGDFEIFNQNSQVCKGLDLPKFTKFHHNSNDFALSFAEKNWKKTPKKWLKIMIFGQFSSLLISHVCGRKNRKYTAKM